MNERVATMVGMLKLFPFVLLAWFRRATGGNVRIWYRQERS